MDVDEEIKAGFDRLANLITDVKESLEREMSQGFQSVNDRFDVQAKRMDKHAALWQTGRRWSSQNGDLVGKNGQFSIALCLITRSLASHSPPEPRCSGYLNHILGVGKYLYHGLPGLTIHIVRPCGNAF